jgi:hypothetical protein
MQHSRYEEVLTADTGQKMGHIMKYDVAISQRQMMRLEMITLLPNPLLCYLIYSTICVVMVVIIGMESTVIVPVMC